MHKTFTTRSGEHMFLPFYHVIRTKGGTVGSAAPGQQTVPYSNHSSLLIYKADFIDINNRKLQLNECVKIKWPPNCFKTRKSPTNFKWK